MSGSHDVVLVHDYLTQRGGAERVALTLTDAFPGAALHTSFYLPKDTLPGFGSVDVRTLALDRIGLLRSHHRMALPVLAPAFSRLRLDAEVAVCSSSGWAHGATALGRKVVYCHTPARWLYQSVRYLDGMPRWTAPVLGALRPALINWDMKAATSADRYLANSSAVKRRIADLYGIDAEVVPPAVDLDAGGPIQPLEAVDPGFYLCVSRLLAYKNVDAVVAAFSSLPAERLVVVGSGPLHDRIVASAPSNVRVLGSVSDAGLRWLYASSAGLIAASYEDFGLTPVEAAGFGKPTAALRWGGFLDTILEDATGVFFDQPIPSSIAQAVGHLARTHWDESVLVEHAGRYTRDRFVARVRQVVDEVRRTG